MEGIDWKWIMTSLALAMFFCVEILASAAVLIGVEDTLKWLRTHYAIRGKHMYAGRHRKQHCGNMCRMWHRSVAAVMAAMGL